MRKLLLSALLATQVFTGISHSFTVYQYNNIANFQCNCNPSACACQQGDLGMSLKLVRDRLQDWGFLYKRHCGADCVNMISDVVHVRLPYLTMDTMQSAVKQANSLIRNAKSSAGADKESEEVFSRVREKVQQYSKTQSESLKNDLTLYLLTQMARDFYGKAKEERITPAEYAAIINEVLTPLNTEGKLTDFIALYLALKKANDPKVKDIAYLMNQFMPSKSNEEFHKAFKYKLDLYRKQGIKVIARPEGQEQKTLMLYIPEEVYKNLNNLLTNDTVKAVFLYTVIMDAVRVLGRKQLPYKEVSAVWWGLKEFSPYEILLSLEVMDRERQAWIEQYTLSGDNTLSIVSKLQEGDEVITIPVVGLPASQPVKSEKPSKARRK